MTAVPKKRFSTVRFFVSLYLTLMSNGVASTQSVGVSQNRPHCAEYNDQNLDERDQKAPRVPCTGPAGAAVAGGLCAPLQARGGRTRGGKRGGRGREGGGGGGGGR